MDTVRLAIFNKNAIVVNKLDNALALQIMVKNHLSPSCVEFDVPLFFLYLGFYITFLPFAWLLNVFMFLSSGQPRLL